MTPDSKLIEGNKQIVHSYIEQCWNKGELNRISEFMATDCRYHDPVFPGLTSGSEPLRQHIERSRRGFPDIKFTIDDTVAERNEVVVHWTITGTHKGEFLGMAPTNKKASVTGTSINKLEGSKIVEVWTSWNLMSLMEQLGVTKAPHEKVNAPAAETKAHA